MKSLVLSTTEAEYVAISEVVKETKLLAILLANNTSVSERTKHVDLREHFVGGIIKDQVIEIKFVKSAENDSAIMTKNQQGPHYLYAKSKLVHTVQERNEKEGHRR